jgi:3-hydroxybutyryl-CoA dehydrogenase
LNFNSLSPITTRIAPAMPQAPDTSDPHPLPHPINIRSVGIVGAGTMGAGIAHLAAAAGCPTLLYDVSATFLERGMARLKADVAKGVEKGKISADAASGILANVGTRGALEELAACDIVIEAAVEDPAVKKEIFSRLSAAAAASVILATNTSSLSVTGLSSSVASPGRFVGLHFFNPPVAMKLVEVVRGDATAEATVAAVTEFARRLGKVPVVAADSPGFIVNRVARPFYGEALKILGEGVATAEEIDRIVRSVGGFRMGPFELMDLIGIDVNLAVTKSVYEQTFGEPRFRPHVIQQRMVDSGRLGRKSGRGFYRYDA